MTEVDIDLSQGPEEETASLKVTPGEKAADEAVDTEFPHFHYTGDAPLDIPKKGVMEVEYEVVFEEQEAGKTTMKIDLHRIVGVEGEGEEESEDLTEPAVGALDRLAAAKTKEKQNVQG